jgi:lysyl-tRNA synthetase class 2
MTLQSTTSSSHVASPPPPDADVRAHEHERRRKLDALRAAGVEPFPHVFAGTICTVTAVAAAEATVAGSVDEDAAALRVAGRLVGRRDGGGISFLDIEDRSGVIQVLADRSRLGGEQHAALALLDLGDILGVDGQPARTRRGVPSIAASAITLLAKSLMAPPDRRMGLRDPEARRRHREVDLLSNATTRERFVRRGRAISEIRAFLDERGFIEVETPILQPLYGGANARPFVTHHNALGRELFMRIAPELYLKRCIVGGLERVYEVGKDFRNEGISPRHNPEFTMVEWYEAYADYLVLADEFEQLLARLARVLGAPSELGFERPWHRTTVCGSILETTGVDVLATPDRAGLAAQIRARGLAVPEGGTWAQLVGGLLSTHVEPTFVEPTLLMDHPVELSPLAKRHRDDPRLVERFEAFAGGMEIANAFSELNDPEEQRARFAAEAGHAALGDDEAQPLDEDFLRALSHGMPPTAGIGVGIDRLVMLLTGADSIRDVVLFPVMGRVDGRTLPG